MSYADISREIYSRKRNTRSIDEQIKIADAMWDREITPDHDGLKNKEVEPELGLDLEYKAKTSLRHLEEIDIIEEFTPSGPETLVIAEWMDEGEGEIVLGEVEEAAREGLAALVTDIESTSATSGTTTAADGSGLTLRSVVAAKLDIIPEKVVEYLRTTDNPVDVLNQAVQSIKDTDGLDVSDGYGEIVFIRMPHRYRLTERAVRLYER